MEQNKLFKKPFKQIFYITDIKQNIIGTPFITKYIPTINLLDSKEQTTALTFFPLEQWNKTNS